jgi:hypothetical protein
MALPSFRAKGTATLPDAGRRGNTEKPQASALPRRPEGHRPGAAGRGNGAVGRPGADRRAHGVGKQFGPVIRPQGVLLPSEGGNPWSHDGRFSWPWSACWGPPRSLRREPATPRHSGPARPRHRPGPGGGRGSDSTPLKPPSCRRPVRLSWSDPAGPAEDPADASAGLTYRWCAAIVYHLMSYYRKVYPPFLSS